MKERAMSRKLQSGFTLIELMIVVLIIGMLAALAVPAYQNYTIRAQVTEGLNLADGWKAAIAEYYANNGAWPSQTDLTGSVPSVGKYVSQVTVASGVIQITYGGPQVNQTINGAVLTMVPYTSLNDDVLWQCGLASAPPGNIASGASAGGTTLAAQQLPTACHS
jgi:type IV pilus assembly protein PilA